MDSPDVNDTCKRPISLQKHLYLVCQANLFRDPKKLYFATPKLYFATPNGVATHSLRSPDLDDILMQGLGKIVRFRIIRCVIECHLAQKFGV